MTPIAYFKLQAKNLFRDYKTQYVYQVDDDGISHYTYNPKYFDVDAVVLDFEEFDEENFSLMKAQHLLAKMLGFKKWSDLLNANEAELKLAKLRFDNQDKISFEEWDMHIAKIEHEHNAYIEPESRLEFFKHGLQHNEGHGFPERDYRLSPPPQRATINEQSLQVPESKPDVQITSLPLSKADRKEFIETANSVFETVMWRMEPRNPKLTRKLWDTADYVDNVLLTKDMLPISKSYALSLIDAFLVHHVLGLAIQADKMADSKDLVSS